MPFSRRVVFASLRVVSLLHLVASLSCLRSTTADMERETRPAHPHTRMRITVYLGGAWSCRPDPNRHLRESEMQLASPSRESGPENQTWRIRLIVILIDTPHSYDLS
ncbi:hypothetical protein BJ875DRAFT_471881 [Amylocarpus encephaloides]|uniref:Secreted protein n=1 Tax=Amylocarpus encephaloides TaxID=45428 RepID=A0A9P7YCN0_9HELO|nr:hypothetical protein BJ875DRAFT_471881 [Amylocarpus encephaloides]